MLTPAEVADDCWFMGGVASRTKTPSRHQCSWGKGRIHRERGGPQGEQRNEDHAIRDGWGVSSRAAVPVRLRKHPAPVAAKTP